MDAGSSTAGIGVGTVAAALNRRVAMIVGLIALIVAYLAYAWVAFEVGPLLARAQPDRAVILGTDMIFHKTHVTWDVRRGGMEVTVEGERAATYPADAPPDWVATEGGVTRVDLGDGYVVEVEGTETRFAVPDYGTIVTRVDGNDVLTTLPGPAPDWIVANARNKFDARPTFDRRVQVSRARIEVHRYAFGWEDFWFAFGHPLQAYSGWQLLGLALSGERLVPEMSNAAFIWDSFAKNPTWQHGHVLKALWETILMAVLGTVTAAVLALPLAFLAAANFAPSLTLRFAIRRVFDFVRGIDQLIWSLIFIRSFGLGPLTGALAIAITDLGSLGKLFSEALENIDDRQVEGVRATGASQIQRYRFGVIPQILPVFVSQTLYYLESNTRSATVIGALGAGGIGLVLVETINTSRDWENVLYIILLTITVVIAMDQFSSWLRRRLIAGKAA